MAVAILIFSVGARAQSLGAAGAVNGVVTDPSGAVIPGASVKIENDQTNFHREKKTDDAGAFKFASVPYNSYKLTITAIGFNAHEEKIDIRSLVPLNLNINLDVAATTGEVVTVEASTENLENIPTQHVDATRDQLDKLPESSPGAGLSDAVTLLAPGVAADSNGLFHPLGDHNESSFSIDGQPISDQQSKAFSTQLAPNAIQSMEVLTGSIPAEYGDKTSLVINATTRSGLDQAKPFGDLTNEYGSFGTINESGTLGFGNGRLGNFTAFNFTRSGRYLDSPEAVAVHDKGKYANIFNRLDYKIGPNDTFHLNLILNRSFFQIANTYDQEALGQNQRQLVRSIDIAPGYVHIFSPSTVLSVNPYYRLDLIKFLPSANPFSDETQTISQQRRLGNAGIRVDLAYNKGKHNAKAGIQISHTFLTEGFQFGITDPAFNAPVLDANGNPVTDPTILNANQCQGCQANSAFLPGLLQFDLTRGGAQFTFNGHTDIKQEAFYIQDAITPIKNLTLSLGLRYDIYRGISKGDGIQPRTGISYLIQKTNTVLRGGYSRAFETPYNENLILSSATGAGGLAARGVLDQSTSDQPLKPGKRDQYNVGFQQAFGHHLIVDADYFWKYTDNGFDFNAILNTPIAFPISWTQSKIDGVSVRANISNYKGFTAFFVGGHTRARYFPPESGGLFFNSDLPTGPFRIDHDQAFESTTEIQYQFSQIKKIAPYMGFTWRYDSGLVAGSVPDFATALTLTPDQQAAIQLFDGSHVATINNPLTGCTTGDCGSKLISIPAAGTENDDHNPARIKPRNIFSINVGTDNLMRTERVRMTARFSVINLTNKLALYNFLSTFSGTHFVAPRAFQGSLGFTF
jgi:outer membrane receptor protein involved in Fe transport